MTLRTYDFITSVETDLVPNAGRVDSLSIHAVSIDYVITNTDNYGTIIVEDTTADRTITLPAAASNSSRLIRVVHNAAQSGKVIVDGNASETINGNTTFNIYTRYEAAAFQCDGTKWVVIDDHFNGVYFKDYSNNKYIKIKTPTIGTSQELTWPAVAPTINQVLAASSGDATVLEWITATGGGAGAGVEILELKNGFEKAAIGSSLSAESYLNESFTNSATLDLALAKNYSTSDTTTIYLDNNHTTVDAMDATTGWSATGGGTVTLNNTEFIEGTGSVKINHTLTGTTGIAKTFTAFNLTDKKLRCRVYLDTVTNLTQVQIKVESSGSNDIYKNWAVANLVVGWNFLELDPKNYTGTTGTFLIQSVTKIYVQFTTSSSQAVNMSTDDIIMVEKYILPCPMQAQIYDTSNQQLISLVSEDATFKGKYTLQATLSNNYTRALAVCNTKNLNIESASGRASFKAALSGNIAKTSWDISRKFLPDTVSGKNLQWSQRFDTENFKVNSFPTTGSIKLASAIDKSGYFKSGDIVWLYKVKYNGVDFNASDENVNVGQSSLRLTLSADATYASSEITLTHGGTNIHGSDDTDWYVIREDASFGYWVGDSASNENITVATPAKLLTSKISPTLIIYDNFNRTEALPANGWTKYDDGSVGTPELWKINGTTAYCDVNSAAEQCYTILQRIDGIYTLQDNFFWEAFFSMKSTAGPTTNNAEVRILFGANVGTTGGGGAGIGYSFDGTNPEMRFVKNAVTSFATVNKTDHVSGNTYYVRLQVSKTIVRAKVWLNTLAEPQAWDGSYIHGTTNFGNYFQIYSSMYTSAGATYYLAIDDMYISRVYPDQYIIKGQETAISGNKIITGTKLTRNDTTNQIPYVYERNALIF